MLPKNFVRTVNTHVFTIMCQCTFDKERYLGDIQSNDTKINSNIQDRQNKGTGYVNQILSNLKEVYFGFYYFSMTLMFRTTNLINGMLCSSEALYGIAKNHVAQWQWAWNTVL